MRGFVKILIYSLLILCCFTGCEREELSYNYPVNDTFKTVSAEKAKSLFSKLQGSSDSSTFLSKSSKALYKEPDWDLYKLKELSFTEAQLGYIDIVLNVQNDFTSKMIFLESEKGYHAAIEAYQNTTYFEDGGVKSAEVFYFDFNGLYLDGYKIEDGVVQSRFVKKSKTSQASFFSLSPFLINDWCNEDLFADNIFCNQDLDAITVTAYKDPDPTPLFVDYWPVAEEIEAEGSGVPGASNSNTPDSCTGGKVPNPDTGECKCPAGMVAGTDGVCVQNCPDQLDRKKDTNKGFFTEKKLVGSDSVNVKKATFAVNAMTGLSESDLNYISQGVANVYHSGGMPMDLKMNRDPINSEIGQVRIKFTSLIITLNHGQSVSDFNAGSVNVTLTGDVVIELVRNIRLVKSDGTNEDIVISNNSLIGTLSHEIGHYLSLKHHWVDFPDLNTESNVWNMMNSLENKKEEFRTTAGYVILSQQKKIIEDYLTKIKRDGKDC